MYVIFTCNWDSLHGACRYGELFPECVCVMVYVFGFTVENLFEYIWISMYSIHVYCNLYSNIYVWYTVIFWNLSWWFLMFWVLINDIIIHVIVLLCVSWSNKSERVETTLKWGAEMISHGNVKFLSIRRTTKHTSGISPEFSLGCILYIIVSFVSVQDVKPNAFWKPGCQWWIPQVTLYPSTYLNDPRSYSQSFYLGYQRKYPCIYI